MIKFLKIIFLFIFLTSNAVAGSDGDLKLSSKSETTKDCFEPLNKATFAFNQGLDNAIFKPIATGYRALPVPIRAGTSNFVSNLRSLLTLSNNFLQGDLKGAGNTAGRFAINTTVGILGVFDPASKKGRPAPEELRNLGWTPPQGN